MPIYLVTVQTAPAITRIVEAKTNAQAVNHVTKDLVSVQKLTATEVVEHAVRGGVAVEKADETAIEAETETQPRIFQRGSAQAHGALAWC